MLHPEMLRVLADTHVSDLRQTAKARSTPPPRPRPRPVSWAVGRALIGLGVRLAARNLPYQTASR